MPEQMKYYEQPLCQIDLFPLQADTIKIFSSQIILPVEKNLLFSQSFSLFPNFLPLLKFMLFRTSREKSLAAFFRRPGFLILFIPLPPHERWLKLEKVNALKGV